MIVIDRITIMFGVSTLFALWILCLGGAKRLEESESIAVAVGLFLIFRAGPQKLPAVVWKLFAITIWLLTVIGAWATYT
jgi:hypothetical protein